MIVKSAGSDIVIKCLAYREIPRAVARHSFPRHCCCRVCKMCLGRSRCRRLILTEAFGFAFQPRELARRVGPHSFRGHSRILFRPSPHPSVRFPFTHVRNDSSVTFGHNSSGANTLSKRSLSAALRIRVNFRKLRARRASREVFERRKWKQTVRVGRARDVRAVAGPSSGSRCDIYFYTDHSYRFRVESDTRNSLLLTLDSIPMTTGEMLTLIFLVLYCWGDGSYASRVKRQGLFPPPIVYPFGGTFKVS